MNIPIVIRPAAGARAWRLLPELALLAVFALLLGWDLGGHMPWWDEGWTLSVARNLAEHGHYGRLLGGEPAPNGLEAAPPVVGLVALSFKLLGVGVWQARVPLVLLTLGALALIAALARQLYGRAVGVATLLVLLLLPMLPNLHVLNLGRQAMAELPLLCFLLAGYVCLTAALRRRSWLLLPAAACWALALDIKTQYLWFWALSLAIPAALLLMRRQWRESALLAGALAGSYLLLRYGLVPIQVWLLAEHTLPLQPISGLVEAIGVVLEPYNRFVALRDTLTFMLPGVLGCGYVAWQSWARWRAARPLDAAEITRISLLSLVVVWWGWYLLLSVGMLRYVFPAFVITSIFQAALLDRLTSGFDLRWTLGRAAGLLRGVRRDAAAAGALLALLLVTAASAATLLFMNTYYHSLGDRSLERTAAFLNTSTSPDALIETYETELFLLLDRPYHYPPDQVHVELILHSTQGRQVDLRYDPLVAAPDYLVTGVFSRGTDLYDATLASGAWRLVRHEGRYDIYERVRP